jgi:type II restriction enzyme
MEKMPNIFTEDNPGSNGVKFLGRIGNKRQYRYIARKYLKDNEYLDAYKLFIPEANNSGSYGEALTDPIIGNPGEGSADTFLNAGPFASHVEAENLKKYYKTKFFRCLLGARKVTQHSPALVWNTIPLQDFTAASDIDWNNSIETVSCQLYSKYNLDNSEIAFIESHVREMI